MTDEQKAENLRIAQDGDVAPDVWPPRWVARSFTWSRYFAEGFLEPLDPALTYRPGVYLGINRRLWRQAFACTLSREHGLVPNRDADEDLAVPIDDVVIEQIERWPERWRPSNPHYVKSHRNAPGTVRSWFRKMRAADVEAAVKLVTPPEGAFFYVRPNLLPWTVLDTMKVVDRETWATYERFDWRRTIYFLPLVPTSSRPITFDDIHGWIDGLRIGPAPPAACLDCALPYAEFPLDVILPRAQWLAIHPDENGLLCAACIVQRVADRLPRATCCHLIVEIDPRGDPASPPGAGRGSTP